MKIRLDQFNPKEGLDRGGSLLVEMAWYFIKMAFFTTPFPWPSSLKCQILRLFGAEIGHGVVIKPSVNILFPWKLIVGDHSWIGEESWILNFEKISIGSHACVSQRAFLCAGNHDFRKPSMPYRNGPITIYSGAWVGAQVFVGPGVEIGEETVITAGSVVLKNLPAATICGGNPATPLRPRWKD